MHNKKKALISLKKAQSHINKVIKMIEKDAYCIDVLQQILAVNGLVKSASDKILNDHLNHCFKEGMESRDEKRKEKLIREVIGVIDLGKRN